MLMGAVPATAPITLPHTTAVRCAVRRRALQGAGVGWNPAVSRRMLASDEIQQLFEHIGEAPELRAAIASQGTGLLQDLGVGARRLARRADDLAESVIRRVLRRTPRSKASTHAGLISRTLAFVLDASIINVGFLALSGLIAFLVSTFTDFSEASTGVLLAGAGLWLAAGALYLRLRSGRSRVKPRGCVSSGFDSSRRMGGGSA